MTNPTIIGDCTLYLGDCLDVLSWPDHGQIDAVVTDPPYGIKNRAQRGYNTRSLKGIRVKRHEWKMIAGDSDPFDPSPWLLYPKVVLWGANHFSDKLPASAAWIVWDKRCSVGRDDNADCEMAWTNLPGVARVHNQLWRGICRAGEENIAKAGAKLHPHQKPVALLSLCLDLCKLSPGDVVVDPYMGSGSCGVAAMRRGLKYIGIDSDPQWFHVARQRIDDAYKQGDMFREPPKKPEQTKLFDGAA